MARESGEPKPCLTALQFPCDLLVRQPFWHIYLGMAISLVVWLASFLPKPRHINAISSSTAAPFLDLIS